MATVKITEDVTTSIVAKVRQLHDADRATIDNSVPDVPTGFAEEVFSLLMPETDRKLVYNALPSWMRQQQATMTLRIMPAGVNNSRWCPVLYLPLPNDTLALPCMTSLEGIPGTKTIAWDGHNMTMYLDEDWSALPLKDKDFISKVAGVATEHNKLTKASKEASDTMRQFLTQYSTVQAAMKVFGPSLKKYIDPWLQMELDRVPPKRIVKKRVAKEKVEVNVSKLVAKATAAQLNL